MSASAPRTSARCAGLPVWPCRLRVVSVAGSSARAGASSPAAMAATVTVFVVVVSASSLLRSQACIASSARCSSAAICAPFTASTWSARLLA